VKVNLNGGGGSFRVQCTLQHFLDVTGAGELYQRAVINSQKSSNAASSQEICGGHSETVPLKPSCAQPEGGGQGQVSTDTWTFTGNSTAPSQDSDREFIVPLTERDIASIVGTMWDEGSLGDQAYFFSRECELPPFPNGAIVSLMDGRLRGLSPEACSDPRTLYLVVSDNNAKWKGEPIPTKEEELLGHWCAFLGQVPVCVCGPVRSGECIGPKPDGSGLGIVTTLGQGPVVGIALADKLEADTRIVKTLCFAGFNALAPLGEDFRRLFLRTGALAAQVDDLRQSVEGCEIRVAGALGAVKGRDAQVRGLGAGSPLWSGRPSAGSAGCTRGSMLRPNTTRRRAW